VEPNTDITISHDPLGVVVLELLTLGALSMAEKEGVAQAWEQWCSWATSQQLRPVPTSLEAVAQWVAAQDGDAEEVDEVLGVVALLHKKMGYNDPTGGFR
jgi:hypothetical protein